MDAALDLGLLSSDEDEDCLLPAAADTTQRATDGVTLVHAAAAAPATPKHDVPAPPPTLPAAATPAASSPAGVPSPPPSFDLHEFLDEFTFTPEQQAAMAAAGPACTHVVGAEDWLPPSPGDAPDADSGAPFGAAAAGGAGGAAAQPPAAMEVEVVGALFGGVEEQDEQGQEEENEQMWRQVLMEGFF